MKAYKGFNRDMKCKGFQFEEGKTYEEPVAILCHSGFHACEHPLNCFEYYPPSKSVYHEVELDGVSDERGNDTKVAAKKITVGPRLTIADMVKAAVDFTFARAKWEKAEKATGNHGAALATGYWGAASATGEYGASLATGCQGAALATGYQGAASATGYQGASLATGDQGAASATGDQGASLATGDYGAASSTGDYGAASATGDYGAASATGYQGAASATGNLGAASATGKFGVAVALGINGKAKGAAGCWIVCAEWKEMDSVWKRVDVRCAEVDGKTIRPDTWYRLRDGAFVEVEDEE